MSKLLLSIIIACSLGLTGCTEEDKQSTGNETLDNALGIKTEEKAEKPEKDKPKTTEKKVETQKQEQKTENKHQEATEEDVAEVAKRRNFVIGQCMSCGKTLRESDEYKIYNKTDDSELVCISCYNEGYHKCMDCGKITNGYDDDTLTGSDGIRCKDCTEAYWNETPKESAVYYCNTCGSKTENPEEVTVDDNGNTICLNCYFAEHDQIGDAPE